MAYLPQELVDAIIDHVHSDRSTLAACARVSRSWLHSSRYHLFASVSLTPQPNAQRRCARLYQLLQDSPSIVPYIRQLHLLDGLPPSQHSGQWIAHERTLPPLLKLLSHLRSLDISASSGVLQWKSLPFTLQNAICTVLKLPSLTYFRLYSCVFPNLSSLAAVLSLCQNLKGLSLSSLTVCDDLDHHPHHPSDLVPKSMIIPLLLANPGDGGGPPEGEAEHHANNEDAGRAADDNNTTTTRVLPPSSPPRLEVLTLDNVNFGSLGYWVLAPPPLPTPSSPAINFRNLRELRVARSADPFLVEQILLSIGPSLEHLHLKPGSWEVYPFDLRNNINLRSLRLTLEVPETALSWCTTLLSSLSPSSNPPSRSLQRDDDGETTLRLTQISFEFWTDLKRLVASSTTTPSASPHHVPVSLSPTATPLPSSSSSLPGSPLQPPPPPLPPSLIPQQQPLIQSTWSSLDSILSHLPSPLLKQVNIGLFAQPSHPDFIRVREALSGIHARMDPDGLLDSREGHRDDGCCYSTGEDCGHCGSGKNGVVRVYQLGVKSQRSFGRICGPRLRSFEGLV